MRILTLIGGAPMSGKTTLSKQIAKEAAAVELSTDSVRSWMQKLVSASEYADLFYSDGMTAEQFYDKYTTPQSIVDGEVAQGVQVEAGIVSLLQSDVSWGHLVIEGIALSPSFMKKIESEYTNLELELIVLVDEDKQRIEERISGRGLWGPLDTYPASLIPKEVEWVVLYNQWFKEQAHQCGIEVRYI